MYPVSNLTERPPSDKEISAAKKVLSWLPGVLDQMSLSSGEKARIYFTVADDREMSLKNLRKLLLEGLSQCPKSKIMVEVNKIDRREKLDDRFEEVHTSIEIGVLFTQ